jgi:7-carboxy-7-deazaguanine synthase
MQIPMLRVNEIFGPTIQGEGPYTGRHCMFVRMYDCNLACTWCDTPYTWANSITRAEKHQSNTIYAKNQNMEEMVAGSVYDELLKYWNIYDKPTTIVISGGEPLMQQDPLEDMIDHLNYFENMVHIETAGTILPSPLIQSRCEAIIVSPKLQHSGNPLSKRYKKDVLTELALQRRTWFKFVVMHNAGMDGEDFAEVDQIVRECSIDPRKVYIMPEGTKSGDVISGAKSIVDQVTQRGYNLSLRMHTLLWGDERKR